MNGRRLGPTDDVEGNGLMRVAAKAFDLEVTVAGVQRVSDGRRWLRRPAEAEHARVPGLAGQSVGVFPRRGRLLRLRSHRRAEEIFAGFGRHRPGYKPQTGAARKLSIGCGPEQQSATARRGRYNSGCAITPCKWCIRMRSDNVRVRG